MNIYNVLLLLLCVSVVVTDTYNIRAVREITEPIARGLDRLNEHTPFDLLILLCSAGVLFSVAHMTSGDITQIWCKVRYAFLFLGIIMIAGLCNYLVFGVFTNLR